MAFNHLVQVPMNLLKIHCLSIEPFRCRWVLNGGNSQSVMEEGTLEEGLADLPRSVDRVQLILPATQVLFLRIPLPSGSRVRRDGSLLAFAVEEETLREPGANRVTWMGQSENEDVVAVVDKAAMQRWLDVLGAAAIHVDEVYCETLLLPWRLGEWSLAWNGQEGFARTGEFEGTVTDRGSGISPPLSLHLLLEEAEKRGVRPALLSLYTIAPMNGPAGELIAEPLPDIGAWQQELGVPIHLCGAWDWRTLSLDSTASLPWEHKRRQILPGLSARSRPAMWIVAVALGIHAVALAADWALLANEQKTLRQQMESQFRTVFPAAIAVVDPVLQMRRKLIEARRAAGLADNSDFLPMMENIATELRELAPGSLRTITYDDGKLVLELAIDNVVAQHIAAGLRKYGLSVETLQAPAGMESGVAIIQARAL